jgi:dipeptidyl aminopeptidase/acylaminoacyl peptidase
VLSYNLSMDGKKLAFHRAPTPQLEDTDQSEVWVMDAGGTNARQITQNGVGESDAQLSPDNSQVLFLAGADQKFETYHNGKVFVAPAAGGRGAGCDAAIFRTEWTRRLGRKTGR